jgi:hypothetical protein
VEFGFLLIKIPVRIHETIILETVVLHVSKDNGRPARHRKGVGEILFYVLSLFL